jgi:hypothetical protein
MPLSEIVNVSITRETTVVTRAGFGTVLIVGENLDQSTPRRIARFTDLTTLAAELDGGTSDPEYAAAATLFAQSPRPPVVAIGHIDVADADVGVTLAAIQTVDDDWYGVVLTYPTGTGRDSADQKLGMAWVETQRKLLIIADDDPDTLIDPGSTSLANFAAAQNYARTCVMYNGLADGSVNDPYAEAGVFGTFVTRDPGSYTVMFKTVAGIAVDALTVTQSLAARGKNALVYEAIGGVDILREGKVAEGEYIDVIVFVDWLQARMTEDIYQDLVNLPKVPFTNEGIGVVETRVKERLQKGVDVGGLTSDTPFVVTVPLSADVDVADKGNRILKDVDFSATLAGAIHAVEVNGTVSL